MSKYYKAEDVIRKRAEDLADTSYWEYGNPKNVDDWIEVAEMEFKDLPTIEVSEENQVLFGTDHNCILTMFGECSYNETGCGSCAVAEKIRKALEDCISREWVLEEFEKGRKTISKSEYFDELVWLVIHAPSVVPSRAEGEWIKRTKQSLIAQVNFAYCSECGQPIMHEHTRPLWNYCPHCGAKMKGAEE